MEQKHLFMERESITKLLLKFSIPAIVGMVINALYNIVDRIYIGNIKNVGYIAITGVGVVFPLVIFMFAFALLIGMGTSAGISLKLGEKNFEEAQKILGVAFFFSMLVSFILFSAQYIFMDKLIFLLGGSEDTFFYAKDYLKILIMGAPAVIGGNTLNTAIRSDGSPKISMISLVFASLINIVLDPIFIFYFDLGVKGAAIATIISQYFYLSVTYYYFTSKYSRIKILRNNIKFNYQRIKNICKLGSSIFAIQIGFSLITYILNSILKKYGGDISIGAMTIIQSIMTFLSMPIFGINQGMQPILGYNYGAKKYKRVKEALYKGIIAATIICITGFTIIRIFSNSIISIFTKNIELQNLANYGLGIYTLAFPIIGFQIVSSIYFQAIGKPKISFFISLSRQIIIMIPCLFILARLFGLGGVWYATPIADTISTFITFLLVRKELKRLNRLEKELE